MTDAIFQAKNNAISRKAYFFSKNTRDVFLQDKKRNISADFPLFAKINSFLISSLGLDA